MEPLDTFNRWSERLRDRARTGQFFRFLWRNFLDDRLFEAAGALSFTTVFALVPLSMVVFGVLQAFPVFDEWSQQLSSYIFANFVPSSASKVESYLQGFADRAKDLTTLGALVAAASLALSTRLFALAVFETQPGRAIEDLMLRIAPVAIELMAFTMLYRVVPHRTVHWRHAFAGAVLAVLMFELVKGGLGLFLGSFRSYETIYGTVAFVPIFLIWVFLGWVSILLGASLGSSISAFRYQPASMRLPEGYELYGILRMLGRFAQAREKGEGLHSDDIERLEPMLTDALVQQLLAELEEIKLLSRAETGEWLLARDLDDLTLAELYETCQLRIPVAEAHLPCRDDALGQQAVKALDELRLPLRDLLRRKVASIYQPPDGASR